ncbi:E3 ubiquitin-protein ligase [Drechslerella dactyloides]|uniref:RBR-type E3 ubiquitin transferase n=1 Tax=Drechslerella dactyloides TaxID=74499 RepID=A0AAD6NND8_DREDA|nr:E3 ubiquitin-protein ligase [Drechslerella dactyloides]
MSYLYSSPGATSSSSSHAHRLGRQPDPKELDSQLFTEEVLAHAISMEVLGETADELTSSPPSQYTVHFQDVLNELIAIAFMRARLEARPSTASSSVCGGMALSVISDDELELALEVGSSSKRNTQDTMLTIPPVIEAEVQPAPAPEPEAEAAAEAETEIEVLPQIQTGTLSPELEAQLRPDTAGGLLEENATDAHSEGHQDADGQSIEFETDSDEDSLAGYSTEEDQTTYYARARRYRSKRQKVRRAIRAVKQAPSRASASIKRAILGEERWSDSPYFLHDEYLENARTKGIVERMRFELPPPDLSTFTGRLFARAREPYFRSPGTAKRECVACADMFSVREVVSLMCGHKYCEGCMKTMVMYASQQEGTMPPKCCNTNIQPGVIRRVLKTEEDKIEFSRKVIEYDTAIEKRLFCPKRKCGAFIPYHPRKDQASPLIGTCQNCGTKACRICKEKAHKTTEDCPEDTGLTAIIELSKDTGWKRCYRCRAMIELNLGCNHMTCRCGAEFCYVCASPWSAEYGCPSGCSQTDDDMVAAMADDIAEAAGIGAEVAVDDPADTANRMEQEAEAKRLIEQRLRRTQEDLVMKALLRTQKAELQMFLRYYENVQFKLKQRHYEEMTDLQLEHVGQSLAHNGELEDRTIECSYAARSAEAEYCRKHGVSAAEAASEEGEHAEEIAALNSQFREEMLMMKKRWDGEQAIMCVRHSRARDNMRSIHKIEQHLTDAELLERKVTFITEQRHVLARMVELRTAFTGQTYVSAKALYDNIVSKDEDDPGLDEKLLEIAIADGLIEPLPSEAARYQSTGFMSPY